uniref:Ycf15 n=1 Tax=Knipowitschia caucasica TaxID=637954 RepID=A0AAV2L9U3_KNICA
MKRKEMEERGHGQGLLCLEHLRLNLLRIRLWCKEGLVGIVRLWWMEKPETIKGLSRNTNYYPTNMQDDPRDYVLCGNT